MQSQVSSVPTISLQQGRAKIREALRQVGVTTGDTILVHSDTSKLMALTGAEWWEDALACLRESIQEAIGPEGTLVVPTFNYDFPKGKLYDHAHTPSQVGFFTNHVRTDPRALRSLHPIFSFAAIGANAAELLHGISKSAFGINSVFDRLYQSNAKLIFYDTSIESCTFIHFVEQRLNVSYRFLKYFTGKLRVDGETYTDTFDFFVRYLGRDIITRQARIGSELEVAGLMQVADFEGGTVRMVCAVDFECVAREMYLQDSFSFLAHPPAREGAELSHPLAPRNPGAKRISAEPLKDILRALHPLHRTLVSEGTDRALEIAGENVPTNVTFTIETYPPTKPIWTWRVPERFVVHEAYLEMQDGRRVVDFAENPLHLVSYSTAIDRWLKWEDLEPHLHFSTRRPDAIPWIFKYYERNWGFCLSKNQFDSLPRDQKYHVVIKTEFGCAPDEGLRVGFAEIPPQPGLVENAYVLVNAHICHPMQSNDDASGVATSIGVLQRIAESPLPPASMGIRFLFGPETIGTICYLAHHENDIPNYLGGIFVEMTGNHNQLTLQRSRQGNHLIDRVMQYVLAARGLQFRQGMFREIIRNDEMVINGPGVDIPCISLSRWPYDEYHTSDDNPDIIHEEMLANAADVVTDVLRIFCSNYVPVRTFRGPIFLSGYQLHVDQHVNRELNKQMEKIMLRLEGAHSIFDIAQELELDYFQVREIIERFRARGLVRANLPSRKVHQ